ncbi:NusG domain II-containing protein [Vogesella oryzae]|uniref:NusG domain II-containing protein n=1 Tax=Vogesella oryzae TaxID=1735285 RepID=UPI0015825663|nr:NusG domain II-containing protein [Vogesella oryzae]
MTLRWPRLLAGDWLLLSLLLLTCGASFHWLWWQQGNAGELILSADGKVVSRWPLRLDHRFELHGPLGITVVEVHAGRARIASDPSPRQYCVRQGWLSRAGETALCLPNRTAISIGGQDQDDTLAF